MRAYPKPMHPALRQPPLAVTAFESRRHQSGPPPRLAPPAPAHRSSAERDRRNCPEQRAWFRHLVEGEIIEREIRRGTASKREIERHRVTDSANDVRR